MKIEHGFSAQNAYSNKLKTLVGTPLKVRINNNRSTMLHVRFKDDATHVSLHHMFIKAPQSIQDALATYIRSRSAALLPSVQAFIDKNVQRLDN